MPNPFSALNRVLSKHKGFLKYHIAMFDFMLTYLLHFWTFCVVFWIIITVIGTSIFKNSNSFNIAKKYVESDSKLIDEIGEIKYYGGLIGGSISSNGNADISFSVIGENGTVDVKSKITSYKVVEIDYRY